MDAQTGRHAKYHRLPIQPALDSDPRAQLFAPHLASPTHMLPSRRQIHFPQYLFSSFLLTLTLRRLRAFARLIYSVRDAQASISTLNWELASAATYSSVLHG